jgi:transposase
MPIREIARRTGLSRNTVRKYLVSDIVEPAYPKRKSPSKLDDYELTLTSWLHRESKRHRKQRRTVKQLHRDLVQLGYTGSYDRVAAFARDWRQAQHEAKGSSSKAFVPLCFAPGEAFQFDWSEDWAVINGVNTKLQIAHLKLSHSRAFILRAYLLQTHEMLFDAHYHGLKALGGVPERGIYDNMKSAVDKIGRGKARVVNKRFQAMVSHYLYEAEFCNAASGWEKGQVEKSVRDARPRLWHDAPRFDSLEELNIWLEVRCKALWEEIDHPEQAGRTIADCWRDEQEALMPLPTPFDGFVEHSKRVSSTCLITFEHNRYSIPASFANKMVSLRVYADRLVIVAEARVIAEHTRIFSRGHKKPGKTIYDWRHYLCVVQRILLRRPGGDREMVDILALVLLHDEQLVEQAIREALEIGKTSKQHVLNCLNRLQAKEQPPTIHTPPALALINEPIANTARYDRLRGGRYEH